MLEFWHLQQLYVISFCVSRYSSKVIFRKVGILVYTQQQLDTNEALWKMFGRQKAKLLADILVNDVIIKENQLITVTEQFTSDLTNLGIGANKVINADRFFFLLTQMFNALFNAALSKGMSEDDVRNLLVQSFTDTVPLQERIDVVDNSISHSADDTLYSLPSRTKRQKKKYYGSMLILYVIFVHILLRAIEKENAKNWIIAYVQSIPPSFALKTYQGPKTAFGKIYAVPKLFGTSVLSTPGPNMFQINKILGGKLRIMIKILGLLLLLVLVVRIGILIFNALNISTWVVAFPSTLKDSIPIWVIITVVVCIVLYTLLRVVAHRIKKANVPLTNAMLATNTVAGWPGFLTERKASMPGFLTLGLETIAWSPRIDLHPGDVTSDTVILHKSEVEKVIVQSCDVTVLFKNGDSIFCKPTAYYTHAYMDGKYITQKFSEYAWPVENVSE